MLAALNKITVLAASAVLALAFPAKACQEALVSSPAVRASAAFIAEAVVVSTQRDASKTANIIDPALLLHLRIVKVLKGKHRSILTVPTSSCSVPGFPVGRRVTVVRYPSGEYDVVERPQRP